AVVWVRPDRDRGPMSEPESGIDPVSGTREVRLETEVRGRVAERPAALVAGDDEAVELERPAEHRGRRAHVALPERRPDRGPRTPGQLGYDADLEPEALEQREVARAAHAEPEVHAGNDRLRADRPQEALGEVLRRELLQVGCERGDEHVLHPRLAE